MLHAPHIGPTAPTPRPRRRTRIEVRMAGEGDGPTLGNLVQHSGWRVEGIDWTAIDAGWLVAEIDGLIVGCIQVLPGKPMGMLDWLGVESELIGRERAMVVKALVLQGMTTLKRWGAQAVLCIIGDDLAEYQAVIRKRGAVPVLHNATVFLRRL